MRGIFLKVIIGALILSFPGALYFLYVADIGQQYPERTNLREITRALEQKERDIVMLDDKIMQARGEMMKFEDLKKNLVNDLIILKEKISEVIAKNSTKESSAVSEP